MREKKDGNKKKERKKETNRERASNTSTPKLAWLRGVVIGGVS